jgi:hypothetical protein
VQLNRIPFCYHLSSSIATTIVAFIYNFILQYQQKVCWSRKMVDFDSNTLTQELRRAAEQNSIQTVRNLLNRQNIDVNARNSEWSPLHAAAGKNYIEIVKLLLEHPKIDVNAQSSIRRDAAHHRQTYDKTALTTAVKWDRLEVVQLLLADPRTDPNIINNDGSTAIMEAVKLTPDPHPILKLLLQDERVDLTIRRKITDDDTRYPYTAFDLYLFKHFGGEICVMFLTREFRRIYRERDNVRFLVDAGLLIDDPVKDYLLPCFGQQILTPNAIGKLKDTREHNVVYQMIMGILQDFVTELGKPEEFDF